MSPTTGQPARQVLLASVPDSIAKGAGFVMPTAR